MLAELRGYWEPQDISHHTKPIDGAVSAAMKKLGLENRFHEEQVFEAWLTMVDGFVAQNARPVALERKVLHIQCLHSTVRYELDRMKGTILERMQNEFGRDRIRDVRFRLG